MSLYELNGTLQLASLNKLLLSTQHLQATSESQQSIVKDRTFKAIIVPESV